MQTGSLLFGANARFIAELHARYLENPGSVDASWASFFADLDDDSRDILAELQGASWAPSTAAVIGVPNPDAPPPAKDAKKANGAAAPAAAGLSAEQVQKCANNIARLDPRPAHD